MARHKKTHSKSKVFGLLWKIGLVFVVIAAAILIYLDATIRTTFSGKKWAVSATVYSRALELYEGLNTSQADIQAELQRLGYVSTYAVDSPGQVQIDNGRLRFSSYGFRFPDGAEPPRRVTLVFDGDVISSMETSDGADLMRLEPMQIGGIYPSHNEDRLLVQLDDVPAELREMLIAAEDENFYQHWGFSVTGILRAMWVNVRSGSMAQGGSTLTQQLVKNFYLNAERTLWRKAREAVMAVLLELHFSKDQILEAYLNEIYLAQDGSRAVHGFGLASQYFFNKPLQSLDLHEQALLVGLVRGPSYYNPLRNPQRALEHRNLILDVAEREGLISAYQASRARSQALGTGAGKAEHRKRFPAYLDLVRTQLRRDYKESDLSSNGLSIFTHFDPRVQIQSELSLANTIRQLEEDGKREAGKLQGAVVISRPNTGVVLAVIGGRDVRFDGFNRALDARRQVGSVIKPAVYLAALEDSARFTPATLLDDTPFELKLSNGDTWIPQNYDRESHGKVMLYRALAHSYNLATARLAQEVGINKVAAVLRRLGVESDVPKVPALALGAADLAPIEVVQMYQTLAGEGFYTPLQTIQSVMTPAGEELSRPELAVDQRFAPATIYQLRYAMEEVARDGTAASLVRRLPDFRVAGKTGTTDDLRDSWFAGFSGDLLAVVWMGNDDNSSTGLTGSTGALNAWADIMVKISELPIQNLPPENVVIGWVDQNTGQSAGEGCRNAQPLPFLAGTEPRIRTACRRTSVNWFN